MTAYARCAIQKEWGQAIWECRSINHRYLDLSFKLPENFREWETDWRHLVGKKLNRGKVEWHLTFLPSSQTAPLLKVNNDLVDQLLTSCKTLSKHAEIESSIKVMELLRWPEVLITEQRDISHLKAPLSTLLEMALEDLVQTRQREGKQLQALIKDKLSQLLQQVGIIRDKLPLCLQVQKQKITQKIAELQLAVENDRLEQELVYYAQRIDVTEEIERLSAHTKEVERALQGQGAMGRRLDFLMQEMNREANTLGAKSLDGTVTQAVVELKVLIEQMREQIQNVE